MRKKLIVANWKSNKNPQEALDWLEKFTQLTKSLSNNNFEAVICPPYIDLPILSDKLLASSKFSDEKRISNCSPLARNLRTKFEHFEFRILLGAQDVSPFDDGSYTGAVSAGQMKGLINYCLVGHSERRRNFGETTASVALKIDRLLAHQIKPIICAQTPEDIPDNIKNYSTDDIIIMFEPAKAISTGGVYQAEKPHVVKNTLDSWRNQFGPYQFLYGGSVNPQNSKNLLEAGAQGFVIGHASLSPDTFYQILLNV